jgi:hypothetical protein
VKRDLAPLPFTPRVVISPEQRGEAFASADASARTFREFAKVPASLVARSKEMDRFCTDRFEKGQTWNAQGGIHLMSDEAAWAWLAPVCRLKLEGPTYVLARFGDAALACATMTASASPHAKRRLFEIVESVEIAQMVAELLAGDARIAHVSEAQREAHAWFDRHPTPGAIALVPMALSKSAKVRKLGERGLVGMADKHMPTVLSIASTYGEDVRDAVAAIMAT